MADMRIITEPAVYVLARPSIDRGELARLLADTGFPEWTTDSPCDAETLVETGARLCYRSFRGGRPHAEHVRHLLEVGHGSCLEHAIWTLAVTGISRTCSHELVRHRHLSPSQESQRYVDAADVAFVVPPALLAAHWEVEEECRVDEETSRWLDTPEGKRAFAEGVTVPCPPTPPHRSAYFAWWEAIDFARDQYTRLLTHLEATGLARKPAREAARSVLPGCVETRMQLTGNARAWRSFIDQRATRHADAEIRRLAVAVFDRLKVEAPGLFGDYKRVPDSTDELTTEYRKV